MTPWPTLNLAFAWIGLGVLAMWLLICGLLIRNEIEYARLRAAETTGPSASSTRQSDGRTLGLVAKLPSPGHPHSSVASLPERDPGLGTTKDSRPHGH